MKTSKMFGVETEIPESLEENITKYRKLGATKGWSDAECDFVARVNDAVRIGLGDAKMGGDEETTVSASFMLNVLSTAGASLALMEGLSQAAANIRQENKEQANASEKASA